MAELARGIALVSNDSADRSAGFDLLAEARSAALGERFSLTVVPIIDLHIAAEKARTEDFDGAIELLRHVIAEQLKTGAALYLGAATSLLVESLLARGRNIDLIEAQDAIEALAAVPTDPGFVVYQLPLLKTRALLAKARDDAGGYRTYADRYMALAQTLDFEGHMATALATE
jgi:Mor family transcriptional regulator